MSLYTTCACGWGYFASVLKAKKAIQLLHQRLKACNLLPFTLRALAAVFERRSWKQLLSDPCYHISG